MMPKLLRKRVGVGKARFSIWKWVVILGLGVLGYVFKDQIIAKVKGFIKK